MAAKLKALQQWCKKQCEGYRDVVVTNMTSSWKSGLAFCAIIHRYRPDLIDYESLSKEDVFKNNKLAFDVASSLGIPALLDAEDMVAMDVPDKLCIITYVAQYYNYFSNKTPQIGRRRKSSQPNAIDFKGPASKQLKPQTLQLPPNDVGDASSDDEAVPPSASYTGRRRGSVVDDVCHNCGGRVYVLERHLSATGQLYHRRCYRRESITSQSSLRRGSITTKSKENRSPARFDQRLECSTGDLDSKQLTSLDVDRQSRTPERKRKNGVGMAPSTGSTPLLPVPEHKALVRDCSSHEATGVAGQVFVFPDSQSAAPVSSDSGNRASRPQSAIISNVLQGFMSKQGSANVGRVKHAINDDVATNSDPNPNTVHQSKTHIGENLTSTTGNKQSVSGVNNLSLGITSNSADSQVIFRAKPAVAGTTSWSSRLPTRPNTYCTNDDAPFAVSLCPPSFADRAESSSNTGINAISRLTGGRADNSSLETASKTPVGVAYSVPLSSSKPNHQTARSLSPAQLDTNSVASRQISIASCISQLPTTVTVRSSKKSAQTISENRHSSFVTSSVLPTTVPARNNASDNGRKMEAKIGTQNTSGIPSSLSTVDDNKRTHARNLLSNVVLQAKVRQPHDVLVPATGVKVIQPSTVVESKPDDAVVWPGKSVIKIDDSSSAEVKRREPTQTSSSKVRPQSCWILPNKMDDKACRLPSTAVTSFGGNKANIQDVKQSQSQFAGNSTVSSAGLADWQVEVERRRAARNGVYVDPAKDPTGSRRAAAAIRAVSSVDNLAEPVKQTAVISNPFSVVDPRCYDSAVIKENPKPSQPSQQDNKAQEAVVRRRPLMTDRSVDVIEPVPARHSIIVDPERQKAKFASGMNSKLAASSVDNLSTLSDKSFGLSSSGKHFASSVYPNQREDKNLANSVMLPCSAAGDASAVINEGRARSTERGLETLRPSFDLQNRKTIIIDADQFSKKLCDSNARLAVSMDDLSADTGVPRRSTRREVGTETDVVALRQTRTGEFSSVDDILTASKRSQRKSTRPLSRTTAFRIPDSGDDGDNDDNETGDKETTAVTNGTKGSLIQQPQDMVVGTQMNVRVRVPQLEPANNESGQVVSTCQIFVEPPTYDDNEEPCNEDNERLNELDIQLCEVEMDGRLLEEKIRGGTGACMEDDEDELMVQWFRLVRRRNELVREESELTHKRRQLELDELQCDLEFQLRSLIRKPSKLKSRADREMEDSLMKEYLTAVAERNKLIDSMEQERKRYLQEDQQLAAMMSTPGFSRRRRSSVLVGLQSSTRRRKSISKPAVLCSAKQKSPKKKLSSFFLGKKSHSNKKSNKLSVNEIEP